MTSSTALAVPAAATISCIDRLHELAEVITREHGLTVGAVRVGLAHAMDAGTALLEVKGLLPHGKFLGWVFIHCAVSPRQASNYMRVARAKEKLTSDSTLTLEQALAVVKGADDLRTARITRGKECCPVRVRREREKGTPDGWWFGARDRRLKKAGRRLLFSTYRREATSFTDFIVYEGQNSYPEVLVRIECFRQDGPPNERRVSRPTGSLELWLSPDALIELGKRLSGMELPAPWSDDEREGAA